MAQQPSSAPQDNGTFKFETKLNVVLVPVLVRDSKGNAIGDLKREDFQVFDKGKLQTLSGFTIQTRAPSPAASPDPLNSAPATGAIPQQRAQPVPERFIAFVFDDYHLGVSDLVFAKKAAAKILQGTLAETDMAAILSLSGKTNTGLTRDRAKLSEGVMSLRVQSLYQSIGHQCPDVSYYQADLILNKDDPTALRAATADAVSCSGILPNAAEGIARSAARQALTLGEQGTRVCLANLREIIKSMGRLPGQHTVILVSPGFLSLTPEAMTEKSTLIDTAAQANVTISAIDARGLYVTMLDASEPGGPGQVVQMKAQYRAAAMTADEDVMAELAYGTGGRFVHNSNDIAGGLRLLSQAPEFLYLLEFIPQDAKQDGSYHKLKVQVDRDGLNLQARRGYYAPKPPKKK